MISGWERPPGEGNGNPLQYSCLEKSHRQRSLVGYSPWGHKGLNSEYHVTLCFVTSILWVILTFSVQPHRLCLLPFLQYPQHRKQSLESCCCSVAQSCPTLWNPWTVALQASLSITNSQSLLKFMSIESVMLSNHHSLCRFMGS